MRTSTKARVELWIAIFVGGRDPRNEVFVGIGEPLLIYVDVAFGEGNAVGILVMLAIVVAMLPFVLE